jgi:transcriptional regulator with XRE-family HTH domain
MRFDKKLRMLMDQRGMNQPSLSRLTGIPQTTISNLLKGSRPGIDHGLKLARALAVSLDYLADDDQDQPPIPDDDSAVILTVIRDLHLERAEAIRRLTTPAPTPGVFRPLGAVELPKGSSRSTHETKR